MQCVEQRTPPEDQSPPIPRAERCPVCGQIESDHSPDMWKTHIRHHLQLEAARERVRRALWRYLKS
jgi:hypothetical protein